MITNFPIAPPIRVKDRPRQRELETLQDACAFVDDALRMRRTDAWRDLHAHLNNASTEDDAIEAIGALRELLMMEGLLESSSRAHT